VHRHQKHQPVPVGIGEEEKNKLYVNVVILGKGLRKNVELEIKLSTYCGREGNTVDVNGL